MALDADESETEKKLECLGVDPKFLGEVAGEEACNQRYRRLFRLDYLGLSSARSESGVGNQTPGRGTGY